MSIYRDSEGVWVVRDAEVGIFEGEVSLQLRGEVQLEIFPFSPEYALELAEALTLAAKEIQDSD